MFLLLMQVTVLQYNTMYDVFWYSIPPPQSAPSGPTRSVIRNPLVQSRFSCHHFYLYKKMIHFVLFNDYIFFYIIWFTSILKILMQDIFFQYLYDTAYNFIMPYIIKEKGETAKKTVITPIVKTIQADKNIYICCGWEFFPGIM